MLLYALITEQSVGEMFIAGVIPGFMGLGLYYVTIAIVVSLYPDLAEPGEKTSFIEKILGLKGLFPFAGVFLFIIGGIYGAIYTD
ncbi:TRAP transporter large permease subunit [Vibrio sp. PP-XX7]